MHDPNSAFKTILTLAELFSKKGLFACMHKHEELSTVSVYFADKYFCVSAFLDMQNTQKDYRIHCQSLATGIGEPDRLP